MSYAELWLPRAVAAMAPPSWPMNSRRFVVDMRRIGPYSCTFHQGGPMRSKIVVVCLIAGSLVLQAQTSPDFNKARDETSRILQDVIRIDTSNGNETKV